MRTREQRRRISGGAAAAVTAVLVMTALAGATTARADANGALTRIGTQHAGGFKAVGSTVFFHGWDTDHGRELWHSDGTAAGTGLVEDIRPGPSDSWTAFLTNVGGTLYFTADDGSQGYQLWHSDGTRSGTRLVKALAQGSADGSMYGLTNVDGTLYFIVDGGRYTESLWRSDGTASGTRRVKGKGGHFINGAVDLVGVNGTLYFTRNRGYHTEELWKSNGTTKGTHKVKAIDTADSEVRKLTSVGGMLYFVRATDDSGTYGFELWRSNGTTKGTKRIRKFDDNVYAHPSHLTNVGGTAYFTVNDSTHGTELWKSNGTTKGTRLVHDINPGTDSSNPNHLTNVRGTAYFTADDGTHGTELWKSNGTTKGTRLVHDINPGTDSSNPSGLTNARGTLFLNADDGSGAVLWVLPTTVRILSSKTHINNGRLTLAMRTPDAGHVRVTGKRIKTVRASVNSARLISVTVRPDRATVSKLKEKHHRKVTVEVAFTPSTGGPTTTIHENYTLRLAHATIKHTRAHPARGTRTLSVHVPYRGRISLHSHGKKMIRKVTRSAARARTLALTIRPTRAGLRTLRKQHHLKVRITLRYKPVPGLATTIHRTYTLKKG